MQTVFHSCLVDLDIETARKAWAVAFPHLSPLVSDNDVLSTLHYARTQAESIRFAMRAYSHRWLLDHGLPSGLPDRLKPSAERICPAVVGCVGIATKTRTPLALAVRDAMEYAVNECYADGHREPEVVRPRMMELRTRVLMHG